MLSASAASAQSSERVRNKLLLPADNGARVVVNEEGDAASIVKALEASQKPLTKINGYRVRIFFDNGQNARAEANTIMAAFKEIHPDIPAYPSYNTSFKVTVGNCLNETEAIMLWGRVKGDFDKAFKVSEEISLDQLAESSVKTQEQTL